MRFVISVVLVTLIAISNQALGCKTQWNSCTGSSGKKGKETPDQQTRSVSEPAQDDSVCLKKAKALEKEFKETMTPDAHLKLCDKRDDLILSGCLDDSADNVKNVGSYPAAMFKVKQDGREIGTVKLPITPGSRSFVEGEKGQQGSGAAAAAATTNKVATKQENTPDPAAPAPAAAATTATTTTATGTADGQATNNSPPAAGGQATNNAPPATGGQATNNAPPATSGQATNNAPPATSGQATNNAPPAATGGTAATTTA